MSDYDTTGWDWPWMIGMMGLVLLGLALVGWMLIEISRRHTASDHRDRTPLGILDERLARGELTIDEHTRLRTALLTSRTPHRVRPRRPR